MKTLPAILYLVGACLFLSGAILLALCASVKSAEPIERFGFPQGEIRASGPLRFAYDSATGNPAWVAEYITHDTLEGGAKRDGLSFKEDCELPKIFRAAGADYAHSGFAKGHMAAAADFGHMIDMNATFTYSNAVPQDEPLNSGLWARLEKAVRADAAEPGVEVYAVTLPLYVAGANHVLALRTIGEHNLVVPTHVAKVELILAGGDSYRMNAWLVANEDPPPGDDFQKHRVTTREVERKSRLDFWPKLERRVQEELETTIP